MKYQRVIAFIIIVLLVFQCKKDLDLEPAVKTGLVDSITAMTAIVHARIIDIGKGISDHGHCYSIQSTPEISDSHTSLGSESQAKEFRSELSGLEPGTTYMVRAYASSGDQTYYGDPVTLTTDDGKALVETNEISEIGVRSAICSGSALSSGGDVILDKGLCWGYKHTVSLSSSIGNYSGGQGLGAFDGILSDLNPGTRYFVNTYAITNVDTSYGISKELSTRDGIIRFDDLFLKDSSSSSISLEIEVTDSGGDSIESLGICWGENESPEISDNSEVLGSSTGRYAHTISNLKQNTLYYIRPFGTNSVNTYYGSQAMLRTGNSISVQTKPAYGIRMSSAQTGGQITGAENITIIERGICWGLDADPTLGDNKIVSPEGDDDYSVELMGLDANTAYYMKAYITFDQSVIFGGSQSFVTDDGKIEIQTLAPGNISYTTAIVGGEILDDGGDTITARGVCWSTSANPTISDARTNNGGGLGIYTSNLNSLTPNTSYYVRAYATNSQGTEYGDPQILTTVQVVSLPVVSTNSISSITQTTAISGGNVSSDGNAVVISRGVCWSTSVNPTITDAHTNDGSGTGNFTSSLTGLNSDTPYYVRAYATNSQGTSYGEQRSLITVPILLPPTVSTNSISSITETSAQGGGNITDDGGAPVLERGVCWSTSTNPTITDAHTNNGNGMGNYSSNLTGLNSNTTYYVRAYATNSIGTNYGEEDFFTTDRPDLTGQTGTLTDVEGNSYQWIGIGKQVWMAENLKVSRYADGSAIPNVEGVSDWDALIATDKAYCWYDNSPVNRDAYGGLYTWAAAVNGLAGSNANPSGVQGVCPTAWHLPSDAEWKELEMHLGMSQVEADASLWRGTDEGAKLKEAGTNDWFSPNTDASNSSGFTALPGGFRYEVGPFATKRYGAGFWTTSGFDNTTAWIRYLNSPNKNVHRDLNDKNYGFSVRCVQD